MVHQINQPDLASMLTQVAEEVVEQVRHATDGENLDEATTIDQLLSEDNTEENLRQIRRHATDN